jgi:hypothetical protein
MANTLTSLIPDLYEAIDVIARECVGYIVAVSRDSNADRAAIGETVRVPVTQASTAADTTPGVTAPNTGDATVDNMPVTITKSRHVPIRWNGEETLGLKNAGHVLDHQCVARIPSDAHAGQRNRGGRARRGAHQRVACVRHGWHFAPSARSATSRTSRASCASSRKTAPRVSTCNSSLGHGAMQNLRGKQSVLFKVNEAGSADMLRNGMTDRVMGLALRQSDVPTVVTKGTGASYVTSGSTAPGITDIALVTGTGTVLAGDVVTFAADANNKYVVKTGVAAPGTISLGKPGARVTIATANALTVGNNFTPNVAFARSAIVLATRAPASPEGGDMAADVTSITDPLTGSDVRSRAVQAVHAERRAHPPRVGHEGHQAGAHRPADRVVCGRRN